jgi:hypothetical protein
LEIPVDVPQRKVSDLGPATHSLRHLIAHAQAYAWLIVDRRSLIVIQLLASVRISPSTTAPIYEGRPLTVKLRITTCSSWAVQPSNGTNDSDGPAAPDASDASSSKPTPMMFDVLAPSEDWIVLGSKKGWFEASVSGTGKRPTFKVDRKECGVYPILNVLWWSECGVPVCRV